MTEEQLKEFLRSNLKVSLMCDGVNYARSEVQLTVELILDNDVVFHQGWFSEILRLNLACPDLMSFCHWCNYDGWHPKLYPNVEGVDYILNDWIGYGMASWTITVKREVLEAIGPLSERVSFWYSDNVYADDLQIYGIKHALVTGSKVDHIVSQTHVVTAEESYISRQEYLNTEN